MNNTLIFDADDVIDDVVLIVSHPTGIKYHAQCGGMGCEHPIVEGFVLPLGRYAEEVDDCSFGCSNLWQMPAERKKLADHLNKYFSDNLHRYYFSFDYDRIDELKEGWWPVIINGNLGDDFIRGEVLGPFKGYIHTGNCD